MMVLLTLVLAACQAVHSDKFTAGDLAQVVPAFSTLPAEAPLGYAPRPGANRILTGRDIQSLAKQAGISTTFQDSVCLEWRMHKLESTDFTEAMRASLQHPDAELRVQEFSRGAVPEGSLQFPLAGLSIPAAGPAFWRGYVVYGDARHFDVWAKVNMGGSEKGQALIDVRAGEMVHVLVENNSSQVKLDARAETSGLVGQKVSIRNPRSGKLFPADVTGRGSVRVAAGDFSEAK